MLIQETEVSCVAFLVERRSGREFSLARFTTTLGRDKENDLILNDDRTVSRQHASIIFDNGNFYIMDRCSKNGTRVNGKKVSGERTLLSSGDTLCIGITEFSFSILESELSVKEEAASGLPLFKSIFPQAC